MTTDKIKLENIKHIDQLSVEFKFPENKILVITGKNGTGKTSLAKAIHLVANPKIFQESSGANSINIDSSVTMEIDGFARFKFNYNKKLKALDTKDSIPDLREIVAELPIPYGRRFGQFSLISKADAELRAKIAATKYESPEELICFLSSVYSNTKFEDLKSTWANNNQLFFLLTKDDYYIREDHFSSGEFFLIQIYRLITSGAKFVFIDELDIALDPAVQVRLYAAIKALLQAYKTRLIVVTHSLAFMKTVDDQGLYHLETSPGGTSLERRSYSYIKSDLFGFKGYDRYILTEDSVLEGFIEYVIQLSPIRPHFQHRTIGLGGVNQLRMIIEKNDRDEIFSSAENVLCMLDGDTYPELKQQYKGTTEILKSPVDDIESFIYRNRETLLPRTPKPSGPESSDDKKASKTYWKYLKKQQNVNVNELYRLVVDNNKQEVEELTQKLEAFLSASE